MSDENFFKDFFERNKPVSYGDGFKGDVCQVLAQIGFAAFVTGNFNFFPVRGKSQLFEKQAHQKCVKHIAESGGSNDPVPAVRLIRYLPLINRDKQPNFIDDKNEQTMGYFPGEDWDLYSAQFVGDGKLVDYLGKKVWAHVKNHPYPTFETEPTQYNSYETDDGEVRPQTLPIVHEVFADESEAREWLEGQLAEVGEPKATSGGGKTWKEVITERWNVKWDGDRVVSCDVPDGWNVEQADKMWDAMPDEEWPGTALQFASDLSDGENVDEYAAMFTGIDVSVFYELKEMVDNHLEF